MEADGTSKDDSKSSPIHTLPANIQRVLPRTIPGPVSPQNRGAIDWGWQDFLAYGAQNTVVVIDPATLQCAQTLSKHRCHVTKVRWRKTCHYHQISAPYSLVLASSDSGGTIIVWDVMRGDSMAVLQDGNKPIQELEWLGSVDGSEHLLAALHPPYSLIIWDTRHNSKLWKKSYTETLNTFHFDPFHFNKMAFLCNGCVLFVEDFSLNKCPSSNGRKFYVSTPKSSINSSLSIPPSASSTSITDDKEKTSNRIKRKMRELVVGEVKPKGDELSQLGECIQLAYHRTVRDQLLLLYPREVLILDLTINQTVGIVAIDRAMSPFTQVIPCRERDVLLCLHDSGAVSAHFRRRLIPLSQTPVVEKENSWPGDSNSGIEQYYEVAYDRKCHSEPLRLSKQNRAIGMAISPRTERSIALVLGDGRVVFKEMTSSPTPGRITASTPLFTPGVPQPPSTQQGFKASQSSLVITDDHFSLPGGMKAPSVMMPKFSLADMIKPAWALPDNIKDLGHKISLRILMTGLMPSAAAPPLVIRMCPPLTTRNLHHYKPFMAAGTQGGAVQIFNLATGMLEREFALHTYPVRGVEWTGLTTILSFGHQPLTNSQGLVRNELIHTDIQTGRSITLRPNKSDETSIDMIRVSYLKQYFIVVFKDDPFELWDARRLTPLRTMPPKFPHVSALEWSPTSHVKARKFSDASDGTGGKMFPSSMDGSMTESTMSLNEASFDRSGIVKETFVFTDAEGRLFNFSVEGNVIKDGAKVPPDSQMSSITSIAWKSHEIVLSDVDGNLTVWDLKTRKSRHIATHRGWVRKIRFAPGKDNLKLLVLFSDGVDIWDVRDVVLISQYKSPRDGVKVADIDWGASDRPVLATMDGCLRVMDMTLKGAHSSMVQYCTKEAIVSPYVLAGEASLNLRTLLTHQPWRPQYSLKFTIEDGFTPQQLQVIETWLSRIQPEVCEFLETCGSTTHRALIVARLFGDQGELDFWTVALQYLTQPPNQNKDDSSSSGSSAELINLGDTSSEKSGCSEETQAPVLPPTHPLETCYNYLCDNVTFKHHELERLAIHESKNLEGQQRAALGRHLAVIGERDRAVRLLLDADSSSNQQFYTDCLRACLLAATHHSTQAQSTIKLVATNLIAAGNIWEGVELLCLIGKAQDSCRYLQSYGHWESSVWLAKCALLPTEACDLMKRFAHHLITQGHKDFGVLILLSVGCITNAVEQLVQQHYHQRAALLLHAAQQMHHIPSSSQQSTNQQSPPPTGDTSSTSSSSSSSSTVASNSSPNTNSSSTLAALSENIHRKYVLHLFSLANRPAVTHFCHLLGEKGQQLLQELDALQ